MTDDDIASILTSTPQSRIALTNLLQGLQIGQFTRTDLAQLLRVWAELASAASTLPEQIASLLASLNLQYSSLRAVSPVLPDPHIAHRLPDSVRLSEDRATVKDAVYVPTWADPIDFGDLGVDFAAPFGTPEYEKAASTASAMRSLKVAPGQTITPPMQGDRAVLFYTPTNPLWRETETKPFQERATYLRQELGLVHLRSAKPQVMLSFKSHLTEDRPDCGRPTAIDAGGNPRFACMMTASGDEGSWGRTVNLGAVLTSGATPGRPERVCGSFPPPAHRGGIEIEIAFVGAPRIDKDDSEEDSHFSDCIERDLCGSGDSLRQRLLDLLK